MKAPELSTLIVNCRRLPFTSTLGVAHALLQLSKALARVHKLTFVVNDLAEFDEGPARDTVRSIAERVITVAAAQAEGDRLGKGAIEVLPHHFQKPEFCPRSILACYDLHAFDIPWKYGDRADALQSSFRTNLLAADAVMTPFPRTYYAVERTAGISLMNLFLTESPLLLDTAPALADLQPGSTTKPSRKRFLYPAQLQAHKNHEALVLGLHELKKRGLDVTIACPGSEFQDSVTEGLFSLVRSNGVEDCFEFLGRVSDDALVALYRDCDAVIVPSLAEGGAYVALEAIAAGKPVAVNSIESAKMHAESMQAHVIWFDATDETDTADAMEQLLNSDAAEWLDRNAVCRRRLADLIEMIEGTGPRPILLTDPRATEVVYG